MQSKHLPSFVVVLLVMSAGSLLAGEVRVKGVHLCCGACVSGVNKALKDIEGVSDVSADRNNKVVGFKTKDAKAAEAGIKALAKAGYYGKATHGDKTLKFPASGAKKGDKSNSVTLTGVHLCCAACVTGAQKALENVGGVTNIDIDKSDKTIKLTGKDIDVTKAVAALNKRGFYGSVKKSDKKK